MSMMKTGNDPFQEPVSFTSKYPLLNCINLALVVKMLLICKD